MRNDRTNVRTNFGARYPAWLHGISCLPPDSPSHESIRSAEVSAGETWEAEGGSVASDGMPKLPLSRAED